MENLANWFHMQLTSSAEAFIRAVEQIPEERRLAAPPRHPEEWSAARHVIHLLSYERRLSAEASSPNGKVLRAHS